MNKKKDKNYNSSRSEYFNDNYVDEQKYYETHQSDIPAGCRACGGPYPGCASSCPMFDD